MAVHRDEYPVAWQLPEEDEQYPGPGAWRGDAPDDSKEPLAASGRLFLVANRQDGFTELDWRAAADHLAPVHQKDRSSEVDLGPTSVLDLR